MEALQQKIASACTTEQCRRGLSHKVALRWIDARHLLHLATQDAGAVLAFLVALKVRAICGSSG